MGRGQRFKSPLIPRLRRNAKPPGSVVPAEIFRKQTVFPVSILCRLNASTLKEDSYMANHTLNPRVCNALVDQLDKLARYNR